MQSFFFLVNGPLDWSNRSNKDSIGLAKWVNQRPSWIDQMGQSKVQLDWSNGSVKCLILPITLPNLNGLGSNNPNNPM